MRKRIFALVLAAVFMASVCGCGEDKPTGGSTGDGSTAQGGSATQGSGAGQDGSGNGQDISGAGTGQAANAQGTNAPGGDGETVLSAEEAGLQVVVYSGTKADFIIEHAVVPHRGGSVTVKFDWTDGKTYSVSLFNEGTPDNDFDGPYQAGFWEVEGNSYSLICECGYSVNGEQVTITVDLADKDLGGLTINSAAQYKLENNVGGVKGILVAADVMRLADGVDEGDLDNSDAIYEWQSLHYVYNDEGGVTIVSSSQIFSEDGIPSEINGRPVTEIGEYAFGAHGVYKGRVDRVIIPDSVKRIGNSAFAGCEHLVSVTFPEGLQSIGESAFSGTGLTSVTVRGDHVTIGQQAFYDCDSLKSVTLQNGVKSIGNRAFMECGNLQKVTIAGSVETIDKSAFNWDEKLSDVTIEDGVKQIGEDAFASCMGLTDIAIPGSVKKIENRAFDNCLNLKTVELKYGVGEIGERVFNKCESLESIDIPGSVNTIGELAFLYCESLTALTVGDGVETIEDKAFSGCSNLENVVLPGGLRKLGQSVFMGDNKIKATYAGRTWTYSQMSSLTKSVNSGSIVSSGASNPELTSSMIGHYTGDGWFGDFYLIYDEDSNHIRFESAWAESGYAYFDGSELNSSTATLVWEGRFVAQLTCTYKNGEITMKYQEYSHYPELKEEVETYTYTKEE